MVRAEKPPEGYDGSARYTVQEQDERNPQHPVYYTIDCSSGGSPTLMCEQPGPWRKWSYSDESEMYVSLETLVELGKLAQDILDGTAVPDDKLERNRDG